MKVYEVISTNLDVQDGYFCNVLFQDIETAKAYCRKELENKQAKNVTEDFEGKLQTSKSKHQGSLKPQTSKPPRAPGGPGAWEPGVSLSG